MKKRILALLLALCAMLTFCSCDEAAAPVGINNVEMNENGELIITLSNGESKNLGNVVGDKGDTGATGAQGEKGDKGDTGAQGPQGEKGDKGNTGAQGPQGEKGDKGDTGATGAQGEKGDKGDTGAQGPQGEKGDKGDTGATGAQGEKGDKGDTGAQGPQGEKGDKGDTGAQGPQGEKGDKGDTGATGAQGEKGEKGDDGVGILMAEIIDGCLWITYSNAPDVPVNVGKIVEEETVEGTKGLAYYPLPDGMYGVMAGNTLYLEEIVIPASYNGKAVSTILPNAFQKATNLTKITIPSSVTSFSDYAFSGCTELTAIYYGGTVSEWEAIAIGSSNNDLTNATVYYYSELHPSTTGNYWHYVDGIPTVWHSATTECPVCGVLSAYDVVYVSNGNGTCYISEIKINPYWLSEFAIQIPSTSPQGDTVTAIRCEPFAILVPQIISAKDFKVIKAKIDEKVASGELSDFYRKKFFTYFSLQSLSEKTSESAKEALLNAYPITAITDVYVIPTDVDRSAILWLADMLYRYAGYTPVDMTEDYTYLHQLASTAENKNEILASLPAIPTGIGTLVTSIEYPETVEEVNFDWILSCPNLKSVVIPKGVTSIDDYAFVNFTELTSVYYTGTASEWSNITIGSNNDSLTNATIYYYSETQPSTTGNYWHYVDGVPTKW